MSFTDAEKRQWHADRKAGRSEDAGLETLTEVCGHCGNRFSHSNGCVTPEFALCDVCNGD